MRSIPIFVFFALWSAFFGMAPLAAQGPDSVSVLVTPVQCYGLRNGAIKVEAVFGGALPYSYSLDGISYTTNPLFDRLWAGDYKLYVRDANGAAKHWPVKVKEPIELKVALVLSDSVVVAGEPLFVKAVLNLEKEFVQELEWRPPFLFPQGDLLEQTVYLEEKTQIAVRVRDKYGCTATDNKYVEVQKAKIFFPNVINPGSVSDAYFTAFAGEGVRKIVTMQVFSRSGATVFERQNFEPNSPLLGWGGAWEGQRVQSGVYPWRALIEYSDGKREAFEGTVTVVY
jgi:hypothetical protein